MDTRSLKITWPSVKMVNLQQIKFKPIKQLETEGKAFHSLLRTFARKFSNIDFFLKILPLKDDELEMSEM